MATLPPSPIYTSQNVSEPAFHLRYAWSGWPSSGVFPALPPLEELAPLWEADGLRLLEHRFQPDMIQFTFSVKPQVSPIFFAARVKGRLQHAYRTSGRATQFSRKVSVRTIGNNDREQVEAYIREQVRSEHFSDPRFRDYLEQFTVRFRDVDLSLPTETLSGRYWYNLHVVLTTRLREQHCDAATLTTIRDRTRQIAEKKGHRISTMSVMPDHVHLALRGNIEDSPETIALSFMNNLAYALGQRAIWEFGYYVGSFGEYDMNAVRGRG